IAFLTHKAILDLQSSILDLQSSVFLESEDESRRRLGSVCGCVGIERGQPEVGPLIYQPSVFQPQGEVVVDVVVVAAAVYERGFRLGVGSDRNPSKIIDWTEGQRPHPGQSERSQA